MKISLKWLSEYIDIADYLQTPQELAKLLTAAGLEIEGVEDLGIHFSNVVIGHLLSVERHPNADRLTLCQVSTGGGVVHQIVCGATNHKTGDRIVAALPGAILPGGFAIKRSKIREVESNGMLCSEVELGLKAESEGILILPEDAPIGESFASYWGLDDILFEVNVTPNRADCLSHVGLAREVSALTGREVHLPELNLNRHAFSTKKEITLEIQDPLKCPRYSGCIVKNVKVEDSPQWLKSRLERVGINSINNVVDITNFVLLELGHPLHAFDLSQIQGGVITVAGAVHGESFVTLDGTQLKLDADDLTIRDASGPVALAGVVGGKNSGVSVTTTNLFIEAAYFRPEAVRRSSRRHGIDTDSSYRFSRGVNPQTILYALDRTCQLLQDIAHGEVAQDFYDSYPLPIQRSAIAIELETITSRLGIDVSAEQFSKAMTRLGCAVEVLDQGKQFLVTPPTSRMDIEIGMDLVEEIARLIGYDKIPENIPVLDEAPKAHDHRYIFERLTKENWAAQGYFESVNYGFLNENFQKKFLGASKIWNQYGLSMREQPVVLMNPLNEDLSTMRQSLLCGLVKNLNHNLNRGQTVGSLFEFGPIIAGRVEGAEGEFDEEIRFAAITWGRKEELWKSHSKTPRVFELKSHIENFLVTIKARNYQWKTLTEAPDCYHPGQTVGLFYEGRMVGILGTLHPSIKEEFKIRTDVAMVELNIRELQKGQPRVHKFSSLSNFPAIERDLAFLLPVLLPASDVIQVIRKAAGPLCQAVEVFDVFTGGTLEAGTRSVAFRMSFQNKEKTLEDTEINKIQDSIITKVKEQLGLNLR